MAQETDFGTWTTEGANNALTTLLAGVPFSGGKLRLYKSTFAPTRSNVLADFVAQEAGFTGYAAVVPTYSAIGIDANGNPVALSSRVFFQATDAVTPQTMGGAWMSDDVVGPPAVHTSVLFFPFAAPIPMTTALAFIGVVVGLQLTGTNPFAIVDH
jgi:hypothetical protein